MVKIQKDPNHSCFQIQLRIVDFQVITEAVNREVLVTKTGNFWALTETKTSFERERKISSGLNHE